MKIIPHYPINVGIRSLGTYLRVANPATRKRTTLITAINAIRPMLSTMFESIAEITVPVALYASESVVKPLCTPVRI